MAQFFFGIRNVSAPHNWDALASSTGLLDGEVDPLNWWYFSLSRQLVQPNLARYTIDNQTRLDQTRLALALESQKRATGDYPDRLDALAPAFPGGSPHDVATGQPYFYEKTPDGSFRLWGTGMDRWNHDGNAKLDLVWRPAELR